MSVFSERSKSAAPFSMKEFLSPPSDFSPAYAWLWNFSVTEDGIRSRLDDMKRAGIQTFYILPLSENFYPDHLLSHLSPDYLSDEFLRLARYAVDYAHSIGMNAWLYDEDGFPSGYAGGKMQKLYGGSIRRKLMAQDESGRIVRKELDDIMLVDSLDDRIGNAYVKLVHERYEQAFSDLLGKEIPLMFTDEPGTCMPAYPIGVEEKFMKAYGYDMTPFLPALMDEKNADTEEKIRARIDYYMLLGELFRKNYLAPIHDWCRKSGVMSSGHLDLDNQTDGCTRHAYGSVLPLLRELDLPGIDVIWQQIYPAKQPGESPCREGNTIFPRFASSAASQTGQRLALSECFAIYGAGLSADIMRYAINYQLARGINVFNFMSVSYTSDGAHPTVFRPGFVKEIPNFEHLSQINEYTARASLLMSIGSPAADTALYFPARDLHAGGKIKQNAMKAFEQAGKMLEDMHIDFDVIDDEGILNAAENDGRLTLGLAKYRSIVIPDCLYMPEDVREKAKRYACPPAPNAFVAGKEICLRTRAFQNGDTLTFIASHSPIENEISMKVPSGCFAALLDLENASAYEYQSCEKIVLPMGGACAVYISKAPISWVSERKKPVRTITIDQFSLSKMRESSIEPAGVRAYEFAPAYFPAETGSWKKYFGSAFSGIGTYRAYVDLKCAPDAESEYVLSLGKIENSARIRINGRDMGIASLTPKCVRIPGSALPESGCFTLEIEIANTLANQTITKPVAEYYPREETGNYNRFEIPFERVDAGGGLFGPVTLSEYR